MTEGKADVLGLKISMLLIRPHHILHALASISYLFLALFGFPFRSAEKKVDGK
jgi:hypothetical protein